MQEYEEKSNIEIFNEIVPEVHPERKKRGYNTIVSAQRDKRNLEKTMEQTKSLKIISEFFALPPVKRTDTEEVKKRMLMFFEACQNSNMIPTVELMSSALGVSRKRLWEWETNFNDDTSDLITQAKNVINANMTNFALQSKYNPIYTMFLQKANYEGYEENKRIEINNTYEKKIVPNLNIEQQLKNNGLVWDDELKDFVQG